MPCEFGVVFRLSLAVISPDQPRSPRRVVPLQGDATERLCENLAIVAISSEKVAVRPPPGKPHRDWAKQALFRSNRIKRSVPHTFSWL